MLLARRSGAELTLVRAVPVSDGPTRPWPGDQHWLGQQHQATRLRTQEARALARAKNADEQTYLQQVGDDLVRQGIVVDTHLEMGDPAEVLLETSAEVQADLIVLSTHGRSGLGRLLFGSVAEAVLARSPVPIFLARAGQPDCTPELSAGGAHLLVPLDGSARAEAALPFAGALARLLAADLSLVEVVGTVPILLDPDGVALSYPLTAPVSDGKASAAAYLESVAARLRAAGLTATTRARIGRPADGIIAAEEETGAALVVMATHGHTGLVDALLGSVARDVLRAGSRPVVLVPRLNC